jgi:hypothetical protein
MHRRQWRALPWCKLRLHHAARSLRALIAAAQLTTCGKLFLGAASGRTVARLSSSRGQCINLKKPFADCARTASRLGVALCGFGPPASLGALCIPLATVRGGGMEKKRLPGGVSLARWKIKRRFRSLLLLLGVPPSWQARGRCWLSKSFPRGGIYARRALMRFMPSDWKIGKRRAGASVLRGVCCLRRARARLC